MFIFSQIDIDSFGSLADLSRRKNLKDAGNNVRNFKRLNILCGRDYSGKIILSRIFRALETGRIPHNYVDPNFTIRGDKGDVTQIGLAGHGYDVRAYNRDSVSNNLGFLVNQTDGEIRMFTTVGEKNKEIEDAITAIQAKLDNVESNAGLRHELEAKKKERDRTKSNHKTASDDPEGKLRSHANNKIEQNRIYGPAVYNIESIKKDIGSVKKPSFIAPATEEQTVRVNSSKQEVLPDITDSISINPSIESTSKVAEELLSRLIKPTLPIQKLLNETALQMWVKEGIPLHKDKRNTCAFCRQNLPHDLRQVLDSHFSKESSDLELCIDSCPTSIATEIQAIPSFLTLTADKFYAEEKIPFETSKKTLTDHLKAYMQDLEALKAALGKRKNSTFQQVAIPVYIHDSTVIQQCVDDINDLITKNNGCTISLENDKNTARESLRLTDVASFIGDITYDTELARIINLKTDADTANTAFTEAEAETLEQETEVTHLQGQQKDERKGVERMNDLLNHFFGHDGIKLEAKDNVGNTSVKFEATRDGKSAYNLSEGECSLIAFCYFIAKLERPDSKDKDLIAYTDDPISNLNGDHISFMFSLTESLIAKPIENADGTNNYRYKQLFISTHNLDFLKYLEKTSLPNEKNHDGYQHFILERNGGASQISLMPSHLRGYITEFNYLFHQIYKCRNQDGANGSHEPFYGFGNNPRKFLEALLFFKFPYHDDKSDALERIKRFFGGEDPTAIALVSRLSNEFPHPESIPDRGFRPVEIPEISEVANHVLDKIYVADPRQYNSLLESVGEPPRAL